MSTDHNPPAFPCEWDYIGSNREAANGMTLRDYFAAKAMQGMLADPEFGHEAEVAASLCYAMADAMLKERAA